MFDLATLTGVPLFAESDARLSVERQRIEDRLQLLPQRVRNLRPVDDDDF